MYYEGFAANAGAAFLSNAVAVTGVPSSSGAPPAPQPAFCAPAGSDLDSLDGRFQNAGTQAGDLYYQVHDESLSGFATPRYFVIQGLNSFAPSVKTVNFVFASSTSSDFNPSIVADDEGRYALNWSYTDTNTPASMRFADNNGGDPSGTARGINVFSGPGCYQDGATSRWGDYSQISVDPGGANPSNLNTHVFWMNNEYISTSGISNSTALWSTETAKVNY
jgi:hypothetical protein